MITLPSTGSGTSDKWLGLTMQAYDFLSVKWEEQ